MEISSILIPHFKPYRSGPLPPVTLICKKQRVYLSFKAFYTLLVLTLPIIQGVGFNHFKSCFYLALDTSKFSPTPLHQPHPTMLYFFCYAIHRASLNCSFTPQPLDFVFTTRVQDPFFLKTMVSFFPTTRSYWLTHLNENRHVVRCGGPNVRYCTIWKKIGPGWGLQRSVKTLLNICHAPPIVIPCEVIPPVSHIN